MNLTISSPTDCFPQGDQAGPAPYYFKGLMPHRFTPEMGKLIVEACKGPFPKGVQPVSAVDVHLTI